MELYSNEVTSLTWGGVTVEIIDEQDTPVIEELETFGVEAKFNGTDMLWEPTYKGMRTYFRIPYRKDLRQIYETE